MYVEDGMKYVQEEVIGICPICGEEMVRHIVKEGARYHVPYWDENGKHCSEKRCELNHGKGKCDRGR